jgi:GAF domain-containing protein
MSTEPWTQGLAALSSYFVGGATLHETLTKVSALAVETVPHADMVGITMIVEGQARTAVFTDEEAVEIDDAQYSTGQGPCVDAFAHGVSHRIEATRQPGRWPDFRRSAAAHGVLSTLSLPLIVDQQPVGAMNFYSRTEAAFTDQLEAQVKPFAAQAAIALANAQAYWDATQLGARLKESIEFRGVIEQAKGILMAAQNCTADAAFELLVRASQRENVKIRDLAQRIVDNVTGPQPDPAPA